MLPRIYKNLLPALLLFGSTSLHAQHHHKCGQFTAEEELLHAHPEFRDDVQKANQELEQFTRGFIEKRENRRSANATQYIIPVVFHVLHLNGPENISDAQIHDAMRILNEDFSDGNNPRLSAIVSSFQPVIGHPNIEFRLARKDPSGNPTDGIIRVVTAETNQGDQDSKLESYWPRDKYLNVWVTKAINGDDSDFGTLAYSQLPGTVNSNFFAPYDGVIIKQQFVGTIGTSVDADGATLTHEVGHYLNLSHPWGNSNQPGLSSNCNIDDGVTDTPNTVGTSSGCNTSQSTCGSLDNVQNFMDYASCELMFTQGQVNRMLGALNSTVASRNNLWDPNNLSATGVDALFEANFETQRINACQGEAITFDDKSLYGADDWDWTFTGGNPATSTDENPSVSYNLPGLYDVTLEAKQGSTTESATKSKYVFVSSSIGKSVPTSEDFTSLNNFPHEEWYGNNLDGDAYEFGVNSNNGYNGGKCIMMDNFGNEAQTIDELYTTTFDLSVLTSGEVSFRYAYKRKLPNDGDKLTLYISNDCGSTWTSIWSKTTGALATVSGIDGNSFTPNATSNWRQETVSNLSNANLTEGVQFKFVFESNKGNNLYLDDFSVDGTLNTVAQLEYPENNSINRASTTTLVWKQMANAASYEYQLDTDQSFGSANLQTGTVSTTTFTPSAPLTNGGTYYWRVRLVVGGTAQAWSSTWKFSVANDGVGFEDLLKEKLAFKVYPNPANENTVVSFETQSNEEVSMYMIDITGRVRTWFENKSVAQGAHVYYLNDLRLSSGVYSIVLKLGDTSISERIIIK